MQRPRRARRAVVFHDDRLANEEEIVKKKRLETSKKRRTNPHIPVPVEPLPDSIQEAQSDPLPAFTLPLRPVHTLEHLEKPTYCAWGLKNRGDCIQGPLNKRKFGDEIINQSQLPQRPSQVKTGCKECRKALCTRKKCWDKWHAQK